MIFFLNAYEDSFYRANSKTFYTSQVHQVESIVGICVDPTIQLMMCRGSTSKLHVKSVMDTRQVMSSHVNTISIFSYVTFIGLGGSTHPALHRCHLANLAHA